LHEALAGIAQPCPARTPIASWPLAETSQWIRRLIESETPARVRVTVQGARGSGRRTFAAAVSSELRLPLLAIDADQVDDAEWRRVYLLAQRQAYLDRWALAWHGESLAQKPWPATIEPFPLQFVIAEPAQEAAPCPDLVEHKVRMPGLSAAERSGLWRHHIPAAQVWPESEFRQLTERYRVHAGDIASVASSGVAGPEEAGLRVREATRGRLGNLAQFLHCPFLWDDLVVPPQVREALEDIVFEANHRVAFWEQSGPRRLFPQGQGLMALFSGPPGTGKTMAAQVMAAALCYDLFRVDLAAVVSKWVGETSQNFERILTRAADMHAMLLFDECDAIFSKRSSEIRDAQDKFANTDAAYLLQAVESYPGVALLATNQKGNIDPAFIRRLRYVLEFAKPDLAQLLDIWRKVVRGLAGEDRMQALDPALRSLSEAIDTTGAQIKFGVLGAMFGAQREGVPLELRHLLRALERELAKEGRMLGARERERILSHAR
jgi:AAA+ superfamily predicted ATPase